MKPDRVKDTIRRMVAWAPCVLAATALGVALYRLAIHGWYWATVIVLLAGIGVLLLLAPTAEPERIPR